MSILYNNVLSEFENIVVVFYIIRCKEGTIRSISSAPVVARGHLHNKGVTAQRNIRVEEDL